MIRTGRNTPIISACHRLIWTAARQPEVMRTIDNLADIDEAVKKVVLSSAPAIRFKDLAIRCGNIDGIIDIPGIGAKLLYVAVSFDNEPLDSHLLHIQAQLFHLNQRKETHLNVDSCFMLLVNKCTGQTKERVIQYDPDFAIDFQDIMDAGIGTPMAMREVLNDQCRACPLRLDCETFARYEDDQQE